MENAGQQQDTSLKALFQGMVPEAVSILQGIVISASPLQIQITGDDKLIISSTVTIVPKHLTNYSVTASITISSGGAHGGHESGDGTHTHVGTANLVMQNALKVGDTVHVLAIQNGKKYYVLDRVV